jgi:hypothetical protein
MCNCCRSWVPTVLHCKLFGSYDRGSQLKLGFISCFIYLLTWTFANTRERGRKTAVHALLRFKQTAASKTSVFALVGTTASLETNVTVAFSRDWIARAVLALTLVQTSSSIETFRTRLKIF